MKHDRKRTTPRLVGLAVATLPMALAIFGPLLAPYGVDEQEPLRYEQTAAGERVPVPPPYPPSRRHLLGTDAHGYDLLTRMLYGARYTVGFVVAVAGLRVLLAFAAAGIGHVGAHSRERILRPRRTALPVGAAVPEFVVAYIAMVGIAFNPPIPPLTFALLQALLLAIIGLPGLVPTIRAMMERAVAQPFVEAQVAAGADERHVLQATVLPALADEFRLLVAHEALVVSLIIGQLAVFGVFVGGTKQTFDPIEYSSRTHEWVGLIGENAAEILGGHVRLVLVPFIGYILVVAAAALLAAKPRARAAAERRGRFESAAGGVEG